jgi:protease-4
LLYYNEPVAFDGGLIGEGVSTRSGIEQTIVTAGRGKDLGNPFRRPTPEEIQILQRGVDSEYAAFVTHVASHRGLDEAIVRDEMGAHIFGTADAKAFKLIDDVKDRGASLKALAELAKLGDDYQLVKPRAEQGGLLSTLLSSRWLGGGPAPGTPAAPAAAGRLRLDAASCESLLRAPLAYYGDATALCR